MKKEKNNITLATHIKWVIGNRIILCLILLSVAVLMSSGYDIFSGFQQVQKSLNSESKNLSEFIVAQSLIDNHHGISVKLEELNQKNAAEKFEWRSEEKFSNKPEIKWKLPLSWVYSYPVRGGDGEVYGELRISGDYFYDNSILIQLITKFSLLFFFAVMIFILLYPLSKRIPQDLFIIPIMNLLTLLRNRSNWVEENTNVTLVQELQEIHVKIIELIDEMTKNAREAALGQLAAQVAHDIRSPLTALDVVIKNILSIPEEQRILIRNATSRIHDIANNLLCHHKKNYVFSENEGTEHFPELIADLVIGVISEKRAQYRDGSIDISIDIDEAAYSGFAKISASEFKRVISNLLNNAIESMSNKASKNICISLVSRGEHIVVSIKDQGCGISSEFLQKIIAGEVSTQKKNGHGLGLPHAIKMIKEVWGGQYVIQSRVDEGTLIEVILPKISVPNWFASKLLFSASSKIIILDDDETIHLVWRNRFKSIDLSNIVIEFYTADELFLWIKENSSQNMLCLIDYELIGSSKNGLDIIEQLNISSSSCLVTSRYEELSIRERCEKLKIKIIPKNFAPHIPICVVPADWVHPDLIFIDDSKILTQAWKMRAKLIEKNILTFNSIEEFDNANAIYCYNKNTPLYIDSDLGCGLSGQDLAKELYQNGFIDIYLSTGYPEAFFGEMPWIKAIVGKHPPY